MHGAFDPAVWTLNIDVLQCGVALATKNRAKNSLPASALFSRWAVAAGLALLAACSDDEDKLGFPTPTDTLTAEDGSTYLANAVVVKRASSATDTAFRKAISALDATIVNEDSLLAKKLGYFELLLPKRLLADDAIAQLKAEGVVESAERNYVMNLSLVPNDTRVTELWGLSQIDAASAWDKSTGSKNVTVAITDTGVDRSHADLKANLVEGFDAVHQTVTPDDDHGHGTHVAGIIGAVGNNGVGVVGVNWTVRMMPIKVCTASGQCFSTLTSEGILWAAENRIKVVNASWGGKGYSLYLRDSIRALGEAGGLLVAAAGNEQSDNDVTPQYPASYDLDNIISVAATGRNDALAEFSNYGAESVDVAAPGVDILSTLPRGSYGVSSGTSMAAPFVTGAAALLLARQPAATYEELKTTLMRTSDTVAGLDDSVGSGARLNLARLVTETHCVGVVCGENATCLSGTETHTCSCASGFEGDGQTCVDVDECQEGTDDCDAFATCENTQGSYTCTCPDGFTGDGQACVDKDECENGTANCDENAECFNNPGSYTCQCLDGLEGDGTACKDIDECATGDALCSENADCTNYFGSYDCSCHDGFGGDGFNCGDSDECALGLDACDAHATCVNAQGSYTCVCEPGYGGTGQFCSDVDECAAGTAECDANAACENIAGNYLCNCNDGYTGSGKTCKVIGECDGTTCTCPPGFLGDGNLCRDVDECAKGTDDCGAHADCTNTKGSFTCECAEGYAGDGKTCADVDECAVGTATCLSGGTCVNTNGGFSCKCAKGYEGTDFNCVDIDECALDTDDCDKNAACTNEPGTFTCSCNAGYVGDGKLCGDFDECTVNNGGCPSASTCINYAGGATCACPAGYTGDGFDCADVDECTEGLANCSAKATCTNTVGDYTCACASGYKGNGTTCSDIDECATGTASCANGTTCVNTSGAYVCSCGKGTVMVNGACADVDECAQGLHNCDTNAACTNTSGGFACACEDGYIGNGVACADVDECALGLDECPATAKCKNTVGAYSCACASGYVDDSVAGDGSVCADIDECAAGTDNCSQNASCTNTAGKFTCACNSGYEGDGKDCTVLGSPNECLLGLDDCKPEAVCVNVDESPGYDCRCADGYEGDGDACTDIDECDLGTDECDDNAACKNTAGSYTCTCASGFTGNGTTCTDVNECTAGTDNCSANATCYNTAGSYLCACNTNYSGDGVKCEKSGCNSNADCAAEATCANTNGGYACVCKTGFTADGKKCTEDNECQMGTDGCAADATCTNTTGSYDCACDEGYAGSGFSCIDVDECEAGLAVCGDYADCNNEKGTYSCSCSPGYDGDGHVCVEQQDHCIHGKKNCDENATCISEKGGYSCGCNPGYVGDGLSCDPNECELGTHACDENAECTNLVLADGNGQGAEDLGYACECEDGFAGDGFTCSDIDECALGTDHCAPHGTCVNYSPYYYCNCEKGFVFELGVCIPEPRFVEEISVGGDHTCALLDNNAVRCWGRNTYGELGYGHTSTVGDDESPESEGYVDVGGDVTQVSVGDTHVCALLDDGNVRCWGRNYYGQLGYGHTKNIGDDEAPAMAGSVDVGGTVVQVAAGGEHTCALLDTGAVRCWGLNVSGQLGYGNTTNVGDDEQPESAGDVPLGAAATAIVAGHDHSCALLETGAVRCWGRGTWAALGYEDREDVGDDEFPLIAGDVDVGGTVTQLSAGWYHTCALLDSGAVRCWGFGYTGQLGYGNPEDVGDDETPASVGDIELGAGAVEIDAGVYHTCALTTFGSVRCFGFGGSGRLGYANVESIGDDEAPGTAGDVDLDEAAVHVATGLSHSCAVLDTGVVRCWGDGEVGQLGRGDTEDIGDDEVPSWGPAVLWSLDNECSTGEAACDPNATCENLPDGYACACNTGYAGDGATCADVDECATSTDQCDPNATCTNDDGGYVCECHSGFEGDGYACVQPGDHVVALSAGSSHTCALLSSGFVRCWGVGNYGQLGYASIDSVGDDETPASVGDVNVGGAVVELATGDSFTCARLSGGSVRCWGLGGDGRLGYGNVTNLGDNEVPATAGDIDLGGEAVQLVAGAAHACAVLSTGGVRCWGRGAQGRLGYGNTNNIGDNESPASAGDVPLGGKAIDIAAGDLHTCAVLETGAVRCWGYSLNGQLGYGNKLDIGDNETPASAGDVSLGGEAVQIAAGKASTCAIMSDGAVRCWGAGTFGRLGYGSTTTIGDDETPGSVNPLVLGDAAVQLTAGAYHNCAILEAGGVRCWGYGGEGRLGYEGTDNIGDNETPASAGDVEVGGEVFDIVAGGQHTCAVTFLGVMCWGNNAFGQLGYARVTPTETLVSGGIVEVLGN